MKRAISMFIRKLQSKKTERRTLHRFHEWENQLQQPEPYQAQGKKLLIIRLDDIGDYILFRNSLAVYKQSEKWKDHHITLLGNEAWKQLFESFDAATTDNAIWLNKRKYLDDASYRVAIWAQLRRECFETVICPSCTRPLLLDDLCALATGAANKIAAANTYPFKSWNNLSDNLYTKLFVPQNRFMYEMFFNNQFANWCCGTNISFQRTELIYKGSPIKQGNYIVCFIGASSRSKRWPAEHWIRFIQLFKQKFSYELVLCGGKAEVEAAEMIQAATGTENMVNKCTLTEMVSLVQHAALVITNNTMAAHMGPACNRPTLIIANGDGYIRFTEYEKAGIENVLTIYPDIFLRKLKAGKANSLHYTAVTADITGISANDVLQKVEKLLTKDK